MRIYYLALSKIPKKFIDDETRCTIWDEDSVMLANPKHQPMMFTEKRGWTLLNPKLGYNLKDWKIFHRKLVIE